MMFLSMCIALNGFLSLFNSVTKTLLNQICLSKILLAMLTLRAQKYYSCPKCCTELHHPSCKQPLLMLLILDDAAIRSSAMDLNQISRFIHGPVSTAVKKAAAIRKPLNKFLGTRKLRIRSCHIKGENDGPACIFHYTLCYMLKCFDKYNVISFLAASRQNLYQRR
jgi:hypothetical protein